MTDYFKCTPVSVDFLTQSKNVFVAEEVIKATPEQIFEVFEDADSWPVWALPIQRVEWTSPKPFGIGTTRTVYMTGGLNGYEEFIEWQPGKRMAFTFVASSKDVTESFVEDYHVEDLGDGHCKVSWYMGMEPKGISRYFMFITRAVMRAANRYMFRKFKHYVEARFR